MKIFGFSILFFLVFVTIANGQTGTLKLYGYGDFVFHDELEREFPNGAIENEPTTFSLLRTHFLINATPANRWRMFFNIRFENFANISKGRIKGQIELFEAWVQFTFSRGLHIKGGKFLSPFGYFNEIHVASPAYHTVVLPLMWEAEFVRRAGGTIIPPSMNLGIFGDYRRGDFKIGYNIYTGNGTTPDESEEPDGDILNFDINDNKGIGVRLGIEASDYVGTGISFYSEKGSFKVIPDMQVVRDSNGAGIPDTPIAPEPLPELVEEQRKTVGLDVRFTPANLEVRGEFVKSFIDVSGGNYEKTFYFVNVNYTFGNQLTPYFELNVYKDPTHYIYRSRLTRFTFGAAFRPNPFIAIKGEVHNHTFGNVDDGEDFGPFQTKQPDSNFASFQDIWIGISFFFK